MHLHKYEVSKIGTLAAYLTCSDIFPSSKTSSKPKLPGLFSSNFDKRDLQALASSFASSFWKMSLEVGQAVHKSIFYQPIQSKVHKRITMQYCKAYPVPLGSSLRVEQRGRKQTNF